MAFVDRNKYKKYQKKQQFIEQYEWFVCGVQWTVFGVQWTVIFHLQ